jgi:hypothetical protein
MLLTFTREASMSTVDQTYDYPRYRWGGPRVHPLGIIATILGFIFWWPVGLAILGYMIWSKSMGCHSSERWHHKMDRMEEKMGRMRDRMERWGGPWQGPRSSGNHAFDEYRTETLRRLEEEQREFKDFLERLRFAKDKAEFDQFMAERRNRQTPTAPPSPQSQG